MPEKVYRLPLDLNRRTCSKKIVVRRNDYDTTVFAVQVFLNGIPYDITGMKPVFECIKPDGSHFRDDGSQYGNMLMIGRNFVLNSAQPASFVGQNRENQITNIYDCYFSKLAGKQIAVSFDYVSTTDNGTIRLQVDSNWQKLVNTYGLNVSRNKQHYSGTIYLDSNQVTNRVSLRMDYVDGTVTISNLKIELNDHATPWSAAPEDGGEVQDVTAGKFKYTLPNELLMAQGEIPGAYFVLEKSDSGLQNPVDRMSTGDIPFTVIPDAVI